jgi:hypothetical protein
LESSADGDGVTNGALDRKLSPYLLSYAELIQYDKEATSEPSNPNSISMPLIRIDPTTQERRSRTLKRKRSFDYFSLESDKQLKKPSIATSEVIILSFLPVFDI